MATLFEKECLIEFDKNNSNWINIKFSEGIFSQYNSIISLDISKTINPMIIYSKDNKHIITTSLKDNNSTNYYINLLRNDPKTKEFLIYIKKWKNLYLKNYLGIKTDIGLYVNIFQSIKSIRTLIGDKDYNVEYTYGKWLSFLPDQISFDRTNSKAPVTFELPYHHGDKNKYIEELLNEKSHFYYYKDDSTKTYKIFWGNDELKNILNEVDIGKLYSSLTVDTSYFSPELQEEFKQVYLANSIGLEEAKQKEINNLKQKQVERIKEAYKLFKELAELLNNSKLDDLNLEKIKLDDIKKIFFKNNGLPNEKGYIEISEFFRNNMIFRMIDLSAIDLTNADIRNMDFSGTNIQINPQTIYNKDMTNVNAKGVHFPFYYSFENTIIDGCIIDDWEAMIDLDKVKSYNNSTYINKSNKKK